ncbi:MAG: hypothetical protein ABJF10_02400 [Chthoniobacter sp.]|uniref:hypothetical protein n=1 Tax=Chthoniobacter sp. TaxID=2510640 RepID=UPI0032A2B500
MPHRHSRYFPDPTRQKVPPAAFQHAAGTRDISGSEKQREKLCLILDREPYRYQKFCSDIAGQDIGAHGGKIERAISEVRDFLRSSRRGVMIPGGAKIFRRYIAFQNALPLLCRKLGMKKSELIFNDFTTLVSEWLKLHAKP